MKHLMKPLMKPLILGATLMLAAALPAQAACYADYRAQQTNPVRFHYGVAQVSDTACSNPSAAAAELRSRLQRGGWILVDVLSTFSDDGLASRRQNAGEFYLAF